MAISRSFLARGIREPFVPLSTLLVDLHLLNVRDDGEYGDHERDRSRKDELDHRDAFASRSFVEHQSVVFTARAETCERERRGRGMCKDCLK